MNKTIERNSGLNSKDNIVKSQYQFPSLEELELEILKLSPCSISDILKSRGIPIHGHTLTAMKRRLIILKNNGLIQTKSSHRLFLIWHSSLEVYRKREIEKRLRVLQGVT